ncbi:MAG TPA: DUF5668 domain-containing protein [Bryobacteraceae bacterium]|jgi:hypothetical protein|nr:DUF5668 domain-containing protein [Bryobacteraceae bacterium]
MNGNSYQIIRAIRGPITLITLGVLFALQNFTNVGFDKTWPVLLIVFGLLSMMQRGAAPPRPPMPPPMPMPPPPRYSATGYSGSPYAQPPAGSPPSNPGSSSPGGTA